MRTASLALLLSLVAPAIRADVTACPAGTPPGVICLTGSVSDTAGGGPLAAGPVYHLSGFVTVPAGETLTIEDSAVVKFYPNARLEVRGTLSCGAAVLTSLADDAGGDTNGDGFSEGAPGDWDGIVFFSGSDASSLDGTSIFYPEAGPVLFEADITMNGVQVEFYSGIGLNLTSSSFPTVTNCDFDFGGFAVSGAPIGAVPGFSGCGAGGNADGDYLYVTDTTMLGGVTIGPDNLVGSEPLVVCRTLTVPAGLTLRLLPGTVVKFGSAPFVVGGCGVKGFEVFGTLELDTVVLTSLQDDSIAGDTNKDGDATMPASGDWGILDFRGTSDASVLQTVLIQYAGAYTLGPFFAPAIDLTAADITLDSVAVRRCKGPGLRLNVGVNSSFPTVTGCAFTDNLGSAVERVPVDAVAGFANNVATLNLRNVMEVSGAASTLNGFASMDKASSLNGDGAFLMGGNLTVAAGAELALGPGVVLKWPATTVALNVQGVLTAMGTAGDPIVLTSQRDDEIVGDSNGDGATSVPLSGDWVGVRLGVDADASLLEWVQIRYAGRSGIGGANAGLEVSGDPTILCTVVERSETGGLDLEGLGRPTVADCTFQDNGGVAVTGVLIRAVEGFSGCSASGNLLGDYIRISDGDVSHTGSGPPDASVCFTELGPTNLLAPDFVLVVPDDLDVPAGCGLSILPGAILKFQGNREFDVDGTAELGGIGDTLVLTSAADDSAGGDTLKDGFTEGTRGDWQGVVVSGPGTSMEDVLVRFAGSHGVLGNTGIALQNAGAQLTDVRVEDCLGAGLHLGGSSLPLVDGSSFDRNDLAVDGVPIRALPGFSNSSAEDNSVGDYQRITEGSVPGGLLVQASQSVNGGVFVLADDVDVLPLATLTLGSSTTFKVDGNRRVTVDGTLVTTGPVVFTTLTDDVNGDTNEDMDATAPTPGSWVGFRFEDGSDDSVLSGLHVRYAGSGFPSGSPSVRLDRANVTLLDSTVERSGGAGMQLVNDARPSVRRNAFDDNQGVPVTGVTVGAIQGFLDNTAAGNVPGDYLRVTDDAIGGEATVSRRNALNSNGVFVVGVEVLVSAPDVLALRQGVILKFEGFARSLVNLTGTLYVEGTGFEPVVITSVKDDVIGGDTQKDGAATVPLPGDWARFELGFAAGASWVEHLHARYGGGAAFAAIELESDVGTARSIRADFSSTDGIRVQRHGGEAVNWVAFDCQGDGIDLAGGSYDLVHATTVDNGGAGIRKTFGHTGSLWSSISFSNDGAQVTGFVPGEVFSSDVGPDFAGFDGNIDADPQLVNRAAGDLRLSGGSPCIDAADPVAALGVVKDHVEAPRILDHDLDGQAGADMGAFELGAYTLAFGGEPRVGTVMSFTVHGPPGLAVFHLGLLGGATFEDPFGFTLYGPAGTGKVLGTVPVGKPLFVPLPTSETIVDLPFGVQGLGRPSARSGPAGPAPGGAIVVNPIAMTRGNYTPVYRARLVL